MFDLDNTIASYDEHAPADDVLAWFDRLRADGIGFYLLSNSKRTERVETFAKALNMSYIMNSQKPSPRALLHAMDMAGCSADASALIGDQIFTDVLAANRAGVKSIIVYPRKFTNPFFKLRYYLEKPFRRIKN